MGLSIRSCIEWIGMAGIYGIVAIAALYLLFQTLLKQKGKVINYVEED